MVNSGFLSPKSIRCHVQVRSGALFWKSISVSALYVTLSHAVIPGWTRERGRTESVNSNLRDRVVLKQWSWTMTPLSFTVTPQRACGGSMALHVINSSGQKDGTPDCWIWQLRERNSGKNKYLRGPRIIDRCFQSRLILIYISSKGVICGLNF